MMRTPVRRSCTPVLTVLGFAFALVACGGSDSSPSDPPNGGPTNGNNGLDNGNGGLVVTTSVDVNDSSFDPDAIQVDPGAEVTWTWTGGESHNVTWVDAGAGLATSPTQSQGTHQVTMPETAGEYTYYCTLHGTPTGGMHGRVVVVD
jgi:plastocyanin